jgi:RNase H-like domain found in reverse transcriptase/Reverse transcriptase (RNA-dependent DNA polymerase)
VTCKDYKDFVVDVRMKQDARPFVRKAYDVPHSIRDKVGVELENLVKAGILEKVEYSDWASPIVVVVKPNKDLRICLDGSVTINPVMESNHYPLPLIDDLLSNKNGATVFSVLDLRGAYQQLIVSEETKKILTVNTHKGLFRYIRMPFGIKPAGPIFQSVMDKILEGIENVQCYLDDLLVWAKNDQEMFEKLKIVLARLQDYNVKVNGDKCRFFVDSVKYLGHIVSAEGISPNPQKVEAIVKAPAPTNASQLKSFLGMIMYYAKFLPSLSIKLQALYNLLKKGAKWDWTDECQKIFEQSKRELCSERVLMHYDPKLPIVIEVNACDQGIGGVLGHRVNRNIRPVFFASRSLTSAERNYPILHREALAVVYALEKFYKYVFGHKVEIFTDHKPLEGILCAKNGMPPVSQQDYSDIFYDAQYLILL